MRNLFVFLICAAFYLPLSAQNWQWVRTANGTGCNEITGITSDSLGNEYVIGNFEGTMNLVSPSGNIALSNNNSITSDIFIAKYDSTGNLIWAKKAGGITADYGQDIQYKNGYLYLTGGFQGTSQFDTITLSINPASQNLFVAKYTTGGNAVWVRKLGGDSLTSAIGTGIALNDSMQIAVSGFFEGQFIAGNDTIQSLGAEDLLTAKFDSLGNFIWVRTAGNILRDYNNDVAIDHFGNVYATGFYQISATFDSITIVAQNEDIFIVKYDAVGNTRWVKNIVGLGDDEGKALELRNSTLFVGGRFSGGNVLFDTVSLSSLNNTPDGFIAAFDTSGSALWAKRMGSNYNDDVQDIFIDAMGKILFAGDFGDTLLLGNDTLISQTGGYDILIGEMDMTGTIQWARRAGSPYQDYGLAVHADPFGNVYAGGFCWGPSDFGPFTITNTGCNNPFLTQLNAQHPTGVIDHSQHLSNAIVFPNPTESNFKVTLPFPAQKATWKLFAASGQLVQEKNLNSETSFIASEQLEGGIYFYLIQLDNGTYLSGKLIIE